MIFSLHCTDRRQFGSGHSLSSLTHGHKAAQVCGDRSYAVMTLPEPVLKPRDAPGLSSTPRSAATAG